MQKSVAQVQQIKESNGREFYSCVINDDVALDKVVLPKMRTLRKYGQWLILDRTTPYKDGDVIGYTKPGRLEVWLKTFRKRDITNKDIIILGRLDGIFVTRCDDDD